MLAVSVRKHVPLHHFFPRTCCSFASAVPCGSTRPDTAILAANLHRVTFGCIPSIHPLLRSNANTAPRSERLAHLGRASAVCSESIPRNANIQSGSEASLKARIIRAGRLVGDNTALIEYRDRDPELSCVGETLIHSGGARPRAVLLRLPRHRQVRANQAQYFARDRRGADNQLGEYSTRASGGEH